MSEQKWTVNENNHITTDEPDAACDYIGQVYRRSHAERIVEEHNACAGIEDVTKWMNGLRATFKYLSNLEYLKSKDQMIVSEVLHYFPPQKEADDEGTEVMS